VLSLLLPVMVLGAQPALPAEVVNDPSFDSATVFATVGLGEWCDEGSVYVDLWTGDYMLVRQTPRTNCGNPETRRQVERGTLAEVQLANLRQAHRRLWIEGPEIADCAVVVMNSGPAVLVITGPQANRFALDNIGCWSDATKAMHTMLDEAFRSDGVLLPATDLSGRREAVLPD
jgi:hypothetical protein